MKNISTETVEQINQMIYAAFYVITKELGKKTRNWKFTYKLETKLENLLRVKYQGNSHGTNKKYNVNNIGQVELMKKIVTKQLNIEIWFR